jgi:hypothetical protein
MSISLVPPPQERLSAEESAILSELSQGLPETFWNRWHELKDRAESRKLLHEEQQERETMIPTLERWHLTCMECILKLSQIRGENPHHTAKTLGISLGTGNTTGNVSL